MSELEKSDKPEVKFNEVESVMAEFVRALQKKDEEKVSYLEEKLQNVIYGYMSYCSSKCYAKNDSMRRTMGSTFLSHRVWIYFSVEKKLPKKIAQVRENPCDETAAECLDFLQKELRKKIRETIIDRSRKEKGGKKFPINEDTNAFNNSRGPSSLEAVMNKEWNKALNEIIKDLPEKEREIFRLVVWQKLSLRDSAGIMGMEESTLRKMRNRIFDKIRKRMKERGFDEYADMI